MLQLQGQNLLPFSLQHQTFLLAVLAETHDEFFLGEQYCGIAFVKEDYASNTATVDLVFNRLPESIPLQKASVPDSNTRMEQSIAMRHA